MSIWIINAQLEMIWHSLYAFWPAFINFWLIKKGKTKWAILNLFLIADLNIWIFDDGFEGQFGYYYFIFPLIIAHFYLFDTKERGLSVFSLLMTLLVFITINVDGLSPSMAVKIFGDQPYAQSFSQINLGISILLSCLLMVQIFNIQKKYEYSLKLAAEKANEANELKSQFLSNMSHELRTPMNAVVGISNYLLNEPLTEFQKKQIDILKFSADNLLNVINDILDYSKLEAEKIELENQHISISELAFKIKESHATIANNKNIGFDLNIDSQIPKYVMGDSKYLIQVLNNLVSNAIKFTDKGSVKLNFECVDKTESDVSIKISVSDTGIGIDESKLPHVFERFTQENSDTKRKYGGTGLGLAISQRLIQFMGSEIKVYSKKGVGSVFWFELTLTISPKDYALFTERPRDINQIVENTVSVLLVEDNEINQLVAGNFLDKWHIAYDVAENGKIAVDMVKSKKYDLILMDIQMPEMNGYEATKAIRLMDNEHYKKVPIIALTASAMMEIRDKIEENGLNDCITKPFKPEELKETIARYVATV